MPTAHQLGVDDVLGVVTSLYSIEGRQRGDEFDMLCPAHGESKVGSCSVNLVTGLWQCLACSAAGDLVQLGVVALGGSYDSVKRSLEPASPDALRSVIQRKLGAAFVRHPKRRLAALPGPYEEGPLDELLQRGFRLETLQRWGVRYCLQQDLQGKTGTYSIHKSIAIPIRDANSRMLAWCYRRTEQTPSWQPRYMYTPDVSLSEVWFGLQLQSGTSRIVVVEGALDAMWLDQAGVPALALLGSTMGKNKLRFLAGYDQVLLFGDYDIAGISAVQRIGAAVGSRTSVRVVRYPKRVVQMVQAGDPQTKVDPQSLCAADIELLVASAVPWTTWLSKAGLD